MSPAARGAVYRGTLLPYGHRSAVHGSNIPLVRFSTVEEPGLTATPRSVRTRLSGAAYLCGRDTERKQVNLPDRMQVTRRRSGTLGTRGGSVRLRQSCLRREGGDGGG